MSAGDVSARRVVWDKSNVLTASDLDAVRSVSSPVGKLRAAGNLPFHWVFERRVLHRVSEVVVTSDEEAQRLIRLFGDRPTTTIPSVAGAVQPAMTLDPTSRTLLWLGTLSYTPNWDGLMLFLRAAERQLRDGGWTVRVVGADADERQIEQLHGVPGVDFRGFVPDLADACEGVAAGVVPVWAGAGVKLKTLTLMSLGVPILATPVALEGIPHEVAARVVETPAEFGTALASLDAAELTAAAHRARSVMEQRFTAPAFSAAVAGLIGARP
ncbi:glycosyltransferase family 4 protein [Trujillonella endophytica]|uniref:glycosyltransferase family 4 protein n=1 Tax=Trujillonella endophytica TaxID=673521 RepID=UPI001113E78D|nr:glycosyltransferase family 4 protein [Trujillella endophytica]